MDFNSLAASRRSVRSFLPKEVPAEHIRALLEAAQNAPSGGNCQPWHFYVIRDQELISRITDKSCKQHFLRDAPLLITVCTDNPRSEQRYGQRGRDLYTIQDTAAAIQNILLCAEDLGLSSCWCGAFDEDALRDILPIPSKQRPVAILPVGYSDAKPSKPQRRPMEDIVTYL